MTNFTGMFKTVPDTSKLSHTLAIIFAKAFDQFSLVDLEASVIIDGTRFGTPECFTAIVKYSHDRAYDEAPSLQDKAELIQKTNPKIQTNLEKQFIDSKIDISLGYMGLGAVKINMVISFTDTDKVNVTLKVPGHDLHNLRLEIPYDRTLADDLDTDMTYATLYTLEIGKRIKNDRTAGDINFSLGEEYGEFVAEFAIAAGVKSKDAGPDGMFGEGADLFINIMDAIRNQFPHMTPEEIANEFARQVVIKSDKWKEKYDV